MHWLLAYLVIGFCWAIWAGHMQFKTGLSHQVDGPLLVCVLLNWLFWPSGMLGDWLNNEMDNERD